jgi:nicotinamidase-related amidase
MADTFAPFAGALLLCIDMQPIFLKALPDAERLVRRCAFAIAAAQGVGLRVAFTEQVPAKLGGVDPELLKGVKKPTIFSKSTFSVLADDGIADVIKTLDVEHLILCGLETPICIYQTALDAVDRNLQVTILSDACGARRPADTEVCLRALIKHSVYVLPSETVFYSLIQGTDHPFFKTFTQLVKSHA